MDRNTLQKHRVTSLLIFAFAMLFYAFFMHAKHDPALSAVNPFADDPYDAVGSFGIQAAVLLGILCLVRAFRSYRADDASVRRESSLFRAQMAAVLAEAVTLAADAVAMLRHPSVWFGSSAGYRLLALLAGMAILAAILGASVFHMAKKINSPVTSTLWTKAVIVSLLAVSILLLYPENFRRGLAGVLFTAGVGAPILFACMWAWTAALVPFQASSAGAAKPLRTRWFARKSFRWAIVILAGVLIGLFFVAGEASEGTGIPHARLALVVSAYVGLETIGLMIGYAFLGKPLSLFRRIS